MQVKSNSIRMCFTILIVVAILGSTISIGTFVIKQITISKTRMQQNSASPIVGTWKGEMGNVLNIRLDGTARSRSSSSTPNQKIGYLEWKLESGQLAIYQYSKGRCSFGWIVERVTMADNPIGRFPVVDFSPTHFKLRSEDGSEFTMTATEDKDLESAR